MKLNKHVIISLLCITLPLAACLNLKQPSNKIEYYTLEYEPAAAEDQPSLPSVIQMEKFAVAPIYNSNRIIYREKSFERQAYAYYRWRVNPGELVTYFLSRDMKKSGLFQAVMLRDSRLPSSYLLEGTVDEFLELDRENGWEAVLGLSIALMDEKEADVSKKFLFQKMYRTSQPCRQKNPRALAEAMSLAMSKLSVEIIEDLYKVLADQKELP